MDVRCIKDFVLLNKGDRFIDDRLANPIIGPQAPTEGVYAYWIGPLMPLQRIPPAAKVLPGLLIVAATVWWGLSSFGAGQPVVAQSASAITAAGRIEGGSDVLSLGTSATGTIASLLVKAGDRVQPGEHLVRVECSNVERELEARKSDLAAAEAFNLRAMHGPRPEEISVGIANVHLAEARLQEAQKALLRTQQLREGFTVTRVQIDQAQRDARMDEALLDEVRAKLALLKAGSREEDITEARSRRDAARARVEEAAARLGYCSVDAPGSGIVLSTNVSPGQFVSAMVPVTLLTMVDDNTRRVRAFIDEGDISKICPRQPARITSDAVPGMQMDGIVESISVTVVEDPFTTNAQRQFRQVMISVPGDHGQTPIGLRVAVGFSPCVSGTTK
jgi:multidrug resistance efflux pump